MSAMRWATSAGTADPASALVQLVAMAASARDRASHAAGRRTRPTSHDPPAESNRHPGDHRRESGGERVGGRAEQQRENARPCDLVRERGESRKTQHEHAQPARCRHRCGRGDGARSRGAPLRRRDRRRRGRGAIRARQQQGASGRERRQGHADACRVRQSQARNQDEAGGQRSDRGPRGIRGVERATGARRIVGGGGVPADRHRIGGPERGRGDEDHAQARRQADRCERPPRGAVGIGQGQERCDGARFERQEQRGHEDEAFEARVREQARSRREARGGDRSAGRAGREAAEEGRHDGARGGGRMADVEREKARPAHLVDEAGQTGSGVEEKEQSPHVARKV